MLGRTSPRTNRVTYARLILSQYASWDFLTPLSARHSASRFVILNCIFRTQYGIVHRL